MTIPHAFVQCYLELISMHDQLIISLWFILYLKEENEMFEMKLRLEIKTQA